MRAEVTALTLTGPRHPRLVRAGEADLRAAGRITGELRLAEGPEGAETVGSDAVLIPVEKPKTP